MAKNIQYSIVVPVFNEAGVVRETYRRLTEVMEGIGPSYELIFINDGSRDLTGEILAGIAQKDDRVKLLDFSRNFGHQIAITAGLDYARGEAVITIDGDLQDPPELIPEMIDRWKDGYEVVYAQRIGRRGETWFKKASAAAFYRLLKKLADIDIPVDTGDFRLMDRKVCDSLQALREKNRFVRGMVCWVGYRQTSIGYVRKERYAGESKYPLKKMLRFSMDGITSFSAKPLKLAGYLGLLTIALSTLYMAVDVMRMVVTSRPAGGSLGLAGLIFINGLSLVFMGVLGEYIGRIYDESKNRPLYILRNKPPADKFKLHVVNRDASK